MWDFHPFWDGAALHKKRQQGKDALSPSVQGWAEGTDWGCFNLSELCPAPSLPCLPLKAPLEPDQAHSLCPSFHPIQGDLEIWGENPHGVCRAQPGLVLKQEKWEKGFSVGSVP